MLANVDAGRKDMDSLRGMMIQALTELASQKTELATLKGEVAALRTSDRATITSNVRVGVMWAALGAAASLGAAWILRGGHL